MIISQLYELSDLRELVTRWRREGASIALVPTMGALHEGHMDLVSKGLTLADKVITSIFVNPTQFAPHEDLARYPRTQASDIERLERAGCHGVYLPTTAIMYPSGFSTSVNVLGVSVRWEGSFRPQFLTGVATVVAKLLLQVAPDVALFGEKDWQQLQVVSKLVTDLNISTQIVGVPTRREADGLAMSSRNAYLTVEERAIAPALKSALDNICKEIALGHNAIDTIVAQAQSNLLKNGFTAIDYLAPCHAQTLEPWVKGDPLRVLGAAWLGKTRLIDNRSA